jgi:dTMP kinase
MPLIVIEGIDGSGTTMHSKLLQKSFEEEGRKSVWTCLPSTGPFGQIVRQVFEGNLEGIKNLPNWRVMVCLFQADQEHHLVQLNEWLKDGLWVVSDRYWLSRMTYQVVSATEAGADPFQVEELIEGLNRHLPLPDATIVLDVTVEEGLRRKNKEPDHFEKKDFLEQVRRRYLDVRGPNIVNISTQHKTPDQTQQEIREALMELGL